MSQRIASIRHLSLDFIVLAFHQALVAVYPSLRAVECLADDTQPYDDFDEAAEVLWRVVVVRSLMWQHDLPTEPALPRYGFFGVPIGGDGYIEVERAGAPRLRFVQFIGSREFGNTLFNAIQAESAGGLIEVFPYDRAVHFTWSRGPSVAA